MKPVDEMEYHETTERLVDILCNKAQNDNRLFFRTLVGYYFSKIASMMHCGIRTQDRGVIPINAYVINLATSGSGKGLSMNVMEDQVLHLFRERFLEETFPLVAEKNIALIAHKRAIKKNKDPDEMKSSVEAEFERLGPLVFSFDSGTTPAVKQMRHKLLMANAGSMNLEIDEIGSNLLGNMEVLTTFLELFDVGKLKQKLVKNTNENQRSEDIDGRTPTNMMLFGTPAKLLNGGKTEEEFHSMLETGYARRCIFSYSRDIYRRKNMTAEEMLDALTNSDSDQFLADLANELGELADPTNFHVKLIVERETTLAYLNYKLQCEETAHNMPEHEEIRKAELSHRYFKALKMAGAYAFIDGSAELTLGHLEAAIKLIEESGDAFNKLLTRDRPYVKLANYIADVSREVTHADLHEDLPFFKGSQSAKQEMLQLAIAYGYKNNIIIKKRYIDGIEFLEGETIKQTNINELILSHSGTVSENYSPEYAPFDQLHKLTQMDNYNFATHHFVEEKRSENTVIEGFNMIALDIDGTADLDTVKLLLKDYAYHIYTTKRHTDKEHRFRLVMPINYTLRMNSDEFREFMQNIVDWLPFEVDASANQRARKWATHTGQYWNNDGTMLDVVRFIPKTTKNDEHKAKVADLQNLDNLERWFMMNTGNGNRNQQLIRYALLLVDAGDDYQGIQTKILGLNNKLPNKLDDAEIMTTIMSTVGKSISRRNAGS